MRPLVIVALVLFPRITAAQEIPPQPLQELFFTENVYPQERGEVQLTLGAVVDRTRADLAALAPFAVEYGLTNRWQIEAGWDGFTHFRTAPLKQLRTARLSLGTKYSFMRIAGSRVHAALGIDTEFPHPDALADDEGEDSMDVEPFVAMAADIGKRFTLFGSAAMSWEPRDVVAFVERATRPKDPGTLGIGGLVAFRHATVAVEYTARSDKLPWRLDGAPLLTPSIVLRPADHWEAGFGVPIGLRNRARQPGVAAHIVKEF